MGEARGKHGGRFFKGTIGSFARKKAQLLVERHQLSLLGNLRKIFDCPEE